MVELGVILASYNYYGGTIGDVLNQWAQLGAFAYVLPFLLMFALIFGILQTTGLFKNNKTVDGIIALTVALMALQFEFVPVFFSQVFPRVGVGLAIILSVMILIGLFIDVHKPGIMYGILGGASIIALVILVQTSDAVGWYSGTWFFNNWPTIAFAVLVIVAIAIVVGAEKGEKGYNPIFVSPNVHPK